MKSINLLPRADIRRAELNGFFLLCTVLGAVIFLLSILLVLVIDGSIGRINMEIANYAEKLADEKYYESDSIARLLIEEQTDIIDSLGIEITPDRIDIDILAFLAVSASNMSKSNTESVKEGQNNINADESEIKNRKDYLLLEEIEYNSDLITIDGIATDRDMITSYVKTLHESNAFGKIDVLRISRPNGGLIRFVLNLSGF